MGNENINTTMRRNQLDRQNYTKIDEKNFQNEWRSNAVFGREPIFTTANKYFRSSPHQNGWLNHLRNEELTAPTVFKLSSVNDAWILENRQAKTKFRSEEPHRMVAEWRSTAKVQRFHTRIGRRTSCDQGLNGWRIIRPNARDKSQKKSNRETLFGAS